MMEDYIDAWQSFKEALGYWFQRKKLRFADIRDYIHECFLSVVVFCLLSIAIVVLLCLLALRKLRHFAGLICNEPMTVEEAQHEIDDMHNSRMG